MLAGFAFAGMMQPLPDEPEALRVLFLVSTVSAMGLQLVTVITTTLISMLSPGLALRGPDGSMHAAVDGMVLHRPDGPAVAPITRPTRPSHSPLPASGESNQVE